MESLIGWSLFYVFSVILTRQMMYGLVMANEKRITTFSGFLCTTAAIIPVFNIVAFGGLLMYTILIQLLTNNDALFENRVIHGKEFEEHERNTGDWVYGRHINEVDVRPRKRN